MNRSPLRVFLVVSIFFGALALHAESASSGVTERYRLAYEAYKNALEKNVSKTALKPFVDEYLAAKNAYQQSFQKAQSADIQADQSTDDGAASLPSSGQGTTQAVAGSGFAGDLPLASYPADLQQTVKDLWDSKTAAYSDLYIQKLQSYIAQNPQSSFANYAKYELARAYENLKNDRSKAEALLSEIASGSQASILSAMARKRLAYLRGEVIQSQWKQTVLAKFQKMQDTYARYVKTSWLAFPVKIARFFSYLGNFGSFKKAQSDKSDFQLSFEELAASYIPSVDVAFDQFQPTQANHDPEARVRLLARNSESWFARWKLLSEARESIDVQYFIVEKDAFGMALLGLLARKAREGVKIRFMIDARGTNKLSHIFLGKDYLEELAAFPNVEIKIFNQFRQNIVALFADVRRIMASNHDKILVVDKTYSVIGGRNIANEYLVDKNDDPNSWRDCDVIIESADISGQLANAFDEEFSSLQSGTVKKDSINLIQRNEELDVSWKAMNSFLDEQTLYKSTKVSAKAEKMLKTLNAELAKYPHMQTAYTGFETLQGAHQCPIKIIDKNSLAGYKDDITDQVVRFIDGSQKEVIIQNPYVVLTPRASAALKRAGKRGVSVLIHTNSPQTSDSFPTEAVMFADWRGILKDIPTARIFAQVGTGQLHAKTFVFDGKVSIVGTYNMDYVSEQINSEVVAAIQSEPFSRELRSAIMNDLQNTKEYHLATKDAPEFGPNDVDGKNMWLVKTLSKMGWLKVLF